MPTVDTSGASPFSGTGGSQTLASFTIGSNSNRYLIVAVWSTGGTSISTPSWNGTAMSALTSEKINGSNHFKVFGLLAPATGAHSLTGTFTSGGGFGLIYYSVYNVSQTGTIDNTVADSGNSNTASQSVSVTPTSDGDMVVFFGSSQGDSSFTMTAPTNGRVSSYSAGNSSTSISGIMGNTGSVSPIASKTGTITLGSANNLEIVGIVLKALNQTSSPSTSIMNAASRSVSVGNSSILARVLSSSLMNASSRFVTMGLFRTMTRTLSDNIMNAASRLVSMLTQAPNWTRGQKNATTWTDTPKP